MWGDRGLPLPQLVGNHQKRKWSYPVLPYRHFHTFLQFIIPRVFCLSGAHMSFSVVWKDHANRQGMAEEKTTKELGFTAKREEVPLPLFLHCILLFLHLPFMVLFPTECWLLPSCSCLSADLSQMATLVSLFGRADTWSWQHPSQTFNINYSLSLAVSLWWELRLQGCRREENGNVMETRQKSHLLSWNILTACWDCSSSSSSGCLWKASQQREGSSDFLAVCLVSWNLAIGEVYNLLSLCSVECCSSLENICFFPLVFWGLLAVWLRKAQTSRCVKVGVVVSFTTQAFLIKKKSCWGQAFLLKVWDSRSWLDSWVWQRS